ncbi:hypothetical protein [Erythrobacter sp. MTPC3]|uniref:hypothetical protein n=1 Tax=Erythrobacter sp. MTPC3 TaxID=3056564 RepID=UPI0036F417AD
MIAPLASGHHLAMAAATFEGCRFRLHGRNPVTGLDCIGLLAVSLNAIGRDHGLPVNYGLRNSGVTHLFGCAQQSGFVSVTGTVRAGDVLLTSPGPAQYHIAIADNRAGIIHAHAGLRRVVCQSRISLPDPVQIWRLP